MVRIQITKKRGIFATFSAFALYLSLIIYGASQIYNFFPKILSSSASVLVAIICIFYIIFNPSKSYDKTFYGNSKLLFAAQNRQRIGTLLAIFMAASFFFLYFNPLIKYNVRYASIAYWASCFYSIAHFFISAWNDNKLRVIIKKIEAEQI